MSDVIAPSSSTPTTAPAATTTAPSDTAPKTETPPASTLGSGPSHGGSIEGYYLGGLGSLGHSGVGVRAGYVAGATVAGGEHRVFFDPSVGFDVGHFSMDYKSPGGQLFNSGFTRYGGYAGAAFRYVPPVLNHRLGISLGVRLGFGGFSTAATTTVTTPAPCTPGDVGRADCEPGAGPQTGNAGSTGLFDPRTMSSTGTSGAYLNIGVPLTVGAEIARGSWGNAQIFGGAELNYTSLFPSGGSRGFDYLGVAGFLGARFNFGGNAVEGAKKDITDPTVDKTVPPFAPGQGLTLDEAAIRALGGLAADDVILGVKLDEHLEGRAPYAIEGGWMTAGPHTISIRYRHANEAEGTEHVRPVSINVGATRVDENNTGPQNFGPFMVTPIFSKLDIAGIFAAKAGPDAPATPANRGVLHRPALVEGEAAKDVPVLTVGSTLNAQFPPNSQAIVRVIDVNGSVVGSPQTITLDPTKPNTITIPRSLPDGAYSVEVTFKTPTSSYQAIYARTLGPDTPPMATITNVKQPITPNSGTSFGRDTINIEFDTNLAGEHRVRVKVGNHSEDITVTAGAIAAPSTTRHVKIPVSGQPGTWQDTGIAGRRYNAPVMIAALDKDGKEGSAIPAGNVTISRLRAPSSGHRASSSVPAPSTGAPRL